MVVNNTYADAAGRTDSVSIDAQGVFFYLGTKGLGELQCTFLVVVIIQDRKRVVSKPGNGVFVSVYLPDQRGDLADQGVTGGNADLLADRLRSCQAG